MLDRQLDTVAVHTARRARTKLGATTIAAIAALALIILACLFATVIAPYDPAALSGDRFAGPGPAHLMGTDELGRDIFSRVLYGGRLTLLISGGASAIALLLGVAWGTSAALSRGWIDEVLMRLADTAMAIPQILFALVFVAAFGADALKLAVVIGLLLAPVTARMVRSAVLAELELDYVMAASAYGAQPWRKVLLEILPNAWPAIGVQAVINVSNAIVLEAALSFVGLGIQPPEASWGTLVQQGYSSMYRSFSYVAFPALIIFLTIWMLNIVGDRLSAPRKENRA